MQPALRVGWGPCPFVGGDRDDGYVVPRKALQQRSRLARVLLRAREPVQSAGIQDFTGWIEQRHGAVVHSTVVQPQDEAFAGAQSALTACVTSSCSRNRIEDGSSVGTSSDIVALHAGRK